MLHDLTDARADALAAVYQGLSAEAVLAGALEDPGVGRLALVSSFGAESVVLLHMVSRVAPATPVLFIDTLMLFEETRAYQRDLAATLDLRDIRVIGPDREELFRRDPDALLHRSNPDACCDLRKTRPLERALEGFDGWITGRKRHQTGARADLPLFEAEGTDGRLKLNPLADWTPEDIGAYIDHHALPRHPLVARGFPSIGCTPCTSRTRPGEDPRAGRWRGRDKTECGIHFGAGGHARRAGAGQEDAA
ncbi:phosphoadenylyl-sulfate reductase [Rhodobacteraceae bacterium WD3A24]|nr:phosphoadenylyl-sulfate reductase [Rhodobacteraceae bacterium WD3A24]